MAGSAVEIDVPSDCFVTFCVGCESPTAQPSVDESMKSEFSFGLAGGLMYAVGLVSRQIPIAPEPGLAETPTIRIKRDMAIIAIDSLDLNIWISC